MMEAPGKPRLAVCWTSGCGGCEAAFLDLGDRLLAVEDHFELAFFPLLVDRKRADLENLGEGAIDLSLITGAIRTSEDAQMAHLLRHASKTVVAFGVCAQLGSVLALADLVPVETLLRTVYGEAFSSDLQRPLGAPVDDDLVPCLPELTDSVRALEALVPVDFFVPGCPPEVEHLWDVLQVFTAAFAGHRELPDRGSVLGGSEATVCEDCARQRPEGKVARFVRLHEADADPSRCLLDEGLVCSGPATRGGCGAPCPAAGAPCRGCYGHPSGIEDPGARMLGALATIAEVAALDTSHPERISRQSEGVLDSVVDPVGTLYRYCYAHSLLAHLREPERHEI
jgi:F420-non-reducing hydrogenase small subunit